MHEILNIAVKVGLKSHIQFNSKKTKAYRAITINELRKLVDKNKEIKAVIIENITQNEYENAKTFITSFKSANKQNKVFFYVQDNDDTTCGLADELDYDIYLGIKELYKIIKNTFKVEVGTEIKLNNVDSCYGTNNIFEDSFDSSFGCNVENTVKEEHEVTVIEEKTQVEIIEENIQKTPIEVIEANTQETPIEVIEANTQETPIEVIEANTEEETVKFDDNEYENKIKKLEQLIQIVEDERESYKNILKEFVNNEEVLEEPITLTEYYNLIKELQETKDTKDNLTFSISSLELEKEETIKSCESRLLEISENVSKLESEKEVIIASYEAKLLEISDNVSNLESEKEEIIASYEAKLLEISDNVSNLESEKEEITKLTEDKERLLSDISDMQYKIKEESLARIKITDILANAVNKIKLTNSLEASLKLECTELKSKLDLVNSQLLAKEYQYNNLVQSCGINEDGVSVILDTNKTIEGINKSLREQIASLKNEIERSNKDKLFAIQSMRNLEESNKQLKVSLNVITAGMAQGAGLRLPPFNYSGKGMVIPVFGCGSFGITTTAMSIALKLANDAKVLYIDFDMISPKADIWFKVMPILTDIQGCDPSSTKSSGLGILIDKQTPFFLSNVNRIIKRVSSTKGGSLDYISGLYARTDTVKLLSTDFSSFFNYCGNNYSYVIVDLGRLGSSEINDGIIKNISDIAHRNVVVTTKEKFDLRNFSLKMEAVKIDKSNTAWLVNMCENTTLEESSKKLISPATHSMMPFALDIMVKRSDFSRDRLTNGKFSLLMDNIFKR